MKQLATIRLRFFLAATILLLCLSAGASASEQPGADRAVTRWNAITTEIMIADNRGVLDSRIYGGIHFVRAGIDGYRQGQGIGRVAARKLKKLDR